jgi:Serine/threonine protein phosphatase
MDIEFGVSENIGWRDRMEDAHAVRKVPEKGFFSAEVYDGHAGSSAAQIAAGVLTRHFLTLFSAEEEKPLQQRRSWRELLRQAYLDTDALLLKKGIISGAAAATFYIRREKFLAANVGDVRVVIGTAQGARVLTFDHKPHLPEERARIEALGGQVVYSDVPRVQGELAISRALGDAYLKPYVTAEPLIVEGILGKENDYVVLACDGVWDVLGPEEVLTLTRDVSCPQKAAELIQVRAIEKGSTDNITVIVVDLREYTRNLEREWMEVLC